MQSLREKAAFICDMDGVIYHGNYLLPGVKEFIDWLNVNGKKFLFLTNSSERSPRELQLKLARLGLDMPDDVASYIADNITTNIRQIEGTVKKIKAYWELTGMEINVTNVSRAIKDMYKGKADTLPTPSLIVSEVAHYHNIPEDTIRGTQRNKGTAEARQIAMYLVRKMTNLSLPDIGKEFSRDHATVIHAVRKVENALADPKNPLNDTIKDITSNINNKL